MLSESPCILASDMKNGQMDDDEQFLEQLATKAKALAQQIEKKKRKEKLNENHAQDDDKMFCTI